MVQQHALQIKLADIPSEGKRFQYSEAFIAGMGQQGPFDTRELGFEATSPIEADLTVEKLGNVVRVKGPVRFSFTMPCARSNEPVPCQFNEILDVSLRRAGTGITPVYVPEGEDYDGEDENDEGEGLAGADLDEWTYSGEELDLAPILYEHIALSIPLKVISERFKDAPEVAWEDEGQEKAAPESPFAALRGLKIDPSSS